SMSDEGSHMNWRERRKAIARARVAIGETVSPDLAITSLSARQMIGILTAATERANLTLAGDYQQLIKTSFSMVGNVMAFEDKAEPLGGVTFKRTVKRGIGAVATRGPPIGTVIGV